MERIPIKAHPYLFDRVFQELQQVLGDNISWLNHIFGKAERLEKDYKTRWHYWSPNVYIGNDQYENIEPDYNSIGNYSFFTLWDPQTLNNWGMMGQPLCMKSKFSLIVFVNLHDIESDDDRNTEYVKREVLRTLHDAHLREGQIEIENVWERDGDGGVFRDFGMDENDNQYMASPYAAFRFEGHITLRDTCK